jgi:hypothetical protein
MVASAEKCRYINRVSLRREFPIRTALAFLSGGLLLLLRPARR